MSGFSIRRRGQEQKSIDKGWVDLLKEKHLALHQCQPMQHSQIELIRQLQQKVQSRGPQLDQMYAFVDTASALDWLNIATHTQYVSFMSSEGQGFSAYWAAQQIKQQFKELGFGQAPFVEVISLACGDANKDCQIMEAMVELMPACKFPFYLLDINTALLEYAYKHAKHLFQDEERVAPISVLGNMYDLSMYEEIFFPKGQPVLPRVIFLLGATIGNISDEIHFFQNALKGFPAGTLLLMDYCLGYASADHLVDIMQKEPYFSNTFPTKWIRAMERFYLGPIRRYKEEKITHMEFRPALEMHQVKIPGSYHIELYGDVTLEDGSVQNFGVQRIKRYDSEKFLDAIEATGWQAISGQRFGANTEMYLFCKK